MILICMSILTNEGFPGSSAGKESACNAGDLGLIPGLERSPGEGNDYPQQYSGLENSMDWLISLLTNDDIEYLFMYFIEHLYIFFGEMSIQILCSFLNQVNYLFITELWVLNTFWIEISYKWLANILSLILNVTFIMYKILTYWI